MGYPARRAAPDEQFPFGHGREVHFWSFVVAMLMLALGAGVSFLKGIAQILAAKTKDLLIGERASPELIHDVMQIVAGFEGVEHANGVLTTQLAPDQVIAIAFADSLRTPQIEKLVEDIETAVIAKRPEIGRLFVKPQTPQAFNAALRLRFESGVTPAARRKRRGRGGRGP